MDWKINKHQTGRVFLLFFKTGPVLSSVCIQTLKRQWFSVSFRFSWIYPPRGFPDYKLRILWTWVSVRLYNRQCMPASSLPQWNRSADIKQRIDGEILFSSRSRPLFLFHAHSISPLSPSLPPSLPLVLSKGELSCVFLKFKGGGKGHYRACLWLTPGTHTRTHFHIHRKVPNSHAHAHTTDQSWFVCVCDCAESTVYSWRWKGDTQHHFHFYLSDKMRVWGKWTHVSE